MSAVAGVVEVALAGLFAIAGVRSLGRWLRNRFEPASAGERIVYALHVTARVGMWFAFAGFFAGYALVDDPASFRWYVLVPIVLSAVQLLTGFSLARPGSPPERER